MAEDVRKVVIPMAGAGHRVREATRGAPKELLPIAGAPLIVHAILEAAASGFEEVLVVLSPQKERLLPWLRSEAPAGIRILPVLQPAPLGLADAQDRCRTLIGDEPFAVLLPDTLFVSGKPALLQVREAFEETRLDTLGLIRVREDDIFSDCGAVETKPGGKKPFLTLCSLGPKRPGRFRVRPGETRLRFFPRSVFLPHYFQFVDRVRKTLSSGEELDDVPVLRRMVEDLEVSAIGLEGRGFDAGTPEGLARARDHFEGE